MLAHLEGYSLTFLPEIGHFHRDIHGTMIDLMLKLGHYWANLQDFSLTFLSEIGHFHGEIRCIKIDPMLHLKHFGTFRRL